MVDVPTVFFFSFCSNFLSFSDIKLFREFFKEKIWRECKNFGEKKLKEKILRKKFKGKTFAFEIKKFMRNFFMKNCSIKNKNKKFEEKILEKLLHLKIKKIKMSVPSTWGSSPPPGRGELAVVRGRAPKVARRCRRRSRGVRSHP